MNATEAQVGHVFAALATQLPVSRQAVVQHLPVLEGAGLVTSRKAGREVLFSVRPGQLGVAASWLTDRAGAWQESLQALKREAESAIARSVRRRRQVRLAGHGAGVTNGSAVVAGSAACARPGTEVADPVEVS